MQRRLVTVLRQLGIAFAAIACATLAYFILYRLDLAGPNRIAPFLLLIAVLASSWFGGYVSGIASVLFAAAITGWLTKKTFEHTQLEWSRLTLLLLLACAVSWIESHRRRLEDQLRAGVEQKTAELTRAIQALEREVRERKMAEKEVRRLNRLLERRVTERTRQLEASNMELESFSYSVSHDLRAPLRSIDGFSRILLTSCESKFDTEERALFQRVLSATDRMNQLIEDLLNLSRVTRIAMTPEQVDLSALAERINAALRSDHPNLNVRCLVEPGITASCDGRLVETVLRNVLENAWKFSGRAPDPCVEFGATSKENERVFFVRDNGAGFDPAYKSKLFVPFQRLHRQEEFPGTGIGLATVARIVHRHGGWITAESQPGKGATFFFTLGPRHEAVSSSDDSSPSPQSAAV